MSKTGKLIAIGVTVAVLGFIFAHRERLKPILTDDTIVVPNPPSNITKPTQVETIVTDPNGNITEKEYTYDPSTSTIVIDTGSGQQNASLFIPMLEMGLLWSEGNWVDHDGYYYSDNHWVKVDNNNWDEHWNNYWNKDWKNNWHNHWENNKNNPNWKYRNQENWNRPGGVSPGEHNTPGQRGERGDGSRQMQQRREGGERRGGGGRH